MILPKWLEEKLKEKSEDYRQETMKRLIPGPGSIRDNAFDKGAQIMFDLMTKEVKPGLEFYGDDGNWILTAHSGERRLGRKLWGDQGKRARVLIERMWPNG